MNQAPRVGILGAGLGSRLQSRSKAKPLAPVGGATLLQHLVNRLRTEGVREITCALREELLTEDDRRQLPQAQGLAYIFVNTESSLHTLGALVETMRPEKGPAVFTMADTVLYPADLKLFLSTASALPEGECAVLATTFVDDEKPLWVKVDERGYSVRFGGESGDCVTSGVYALNPQAMEIALENIKSGTSKMRNFLANLAERRVPVKTVVVAKTIDVDHPSDLDKAEEFFR
jgi:NDP-sugar pyrophosphorylase family protein